MKNVLLPAGTGFNTRLMKVYQDILSIRTAINKIGRLNESIGLVPTMGALHEGHFSLIHAAKKENDITIVTIFVNPIQFNNPEDLKNYPSSYEGDLAILEKIGCDMVFAPSVDEMYPKKPVINLSLGKMEEIMEGVYRPGHFNGVAIVVMKLFNILRPSRAYFGQKDLQQFKIIEQMVNDTSMNVDVKMMPIIREKSGLAMSSRNHRLSGTGKEIATHIYKAIILAANEIKAGRPVKESIAQARDYLATYQEIRLEYLELVNLNNLHAVEIANGTDQLALCIAGYVENIRLIDNLIIKR